MGQEIEFPSNGGTGGGYLAEPSGGAGPGVVVIQEWWGLVPHITAVADRFASEGFTALAPDLYHGTKVPNSEPDEAGKQMMALRMDQAGKDLSGAVDELQRRTGRDHVGAVGFCMGGGLALVLAAQRPDAVTACVPFYGLIPWPDAAPDYAQLSAVVQAHIAGEDSYFGPDAARALEMQLQELGKQTDFHIYDGAQHAFFNDTRPEVYDAKAAAQAFARTVEFLHDQLG
ncbi:MAG TPA: dienelactone hydrolase family protein [Acidimicrobiales bacterium]|nr:dienelactone hydrolase family protein [Acidimicrobiales bacterium]